MIERDCTYAFLDRFREEMNGVVWIGLGRLSLTFWGYWWNQSSAKILSCSEVVFWGVKDFGAEFGGVLADESVSWVVLAGSGVNTVSVWVGSAVLLGHFVYPWVHILWANWINLLLIFHLIVEGGVGGGDWGLEDGDFFWTSWHNINWCWLILLINLTVVGGSVAGIWGLEDGNFFGLIGDSLITWWSCLCHINKLGSDAVIVSSSESSIWGLED